MKICTWRLYPSGVWRTNCNQRITELKGSYPRSRGWLFCPYCGRKIEAKMVEEEGGE